MSLRELVSACRAVKFDWKGFPNRSGFSLPAEHSETKASEKVIGCALPAVFRDFLATSDGALLFPWDGTEHEGGIRLFCTEEIRRWHPFWAEHYDPDTSLVQPCWFVGNLNSFGDPIALGVDGPLYLMGPHFGPDDWDKIGGKTELARDLGSFLRTLIEISPPITGCFHPLMTS